MLKYGSLNGKTKYKYEREKFTTTNYYRTKFKHHAITQGEMTRENYWRKHNVSNKERKNIFSIMNHWERRMTPKCNCKLSAKMKYSNTRTVGWNRMAQYAKWQEQTTAWTNSCLPSFRRGSTPRYGSLSYHPENNISTFQPLLTIQSTTTSLHIHRFFSHTIHGRNLRCNFRCPIILHVLRADA